MKKFTITTATVGALAAAALGLAATAAAVPTGGSATDTLTALQDQGYSVQLNGSVQGPLSRCTVTGVHGLSGTMTSMDVMMMLMEPAEFDTVYVDVSCPSSNT